MQAQLLQETACILGEGACWHAARNSFFWVDIEGRTLYEYHLPTRSTRSWKAAQMISTIVLDGQGQLVLGAQGGIIRFNADTGQFSSLLPLSFAEAPFRCNDGKCDPAGRLWVGVMHTQTQNANGALYCITPGLSVALKVPGVSVSNGIVWTEDQQWMYFADSPTYRIAAYRYDNATGNIQFERHAVTATSDQGQPDGIAIDEEGMIWACHYGAGAVNRWNPQTGELLQTITVPAPNVTSCAFGGPDRNLLLITTARENMPPEQLEAYPLSGGVFTATTPVKGPALPVFNV